MLFEANRPYEQWYNSRERLELAPEDKKTILGVAESTTEKSEFKGYVRRAKRIKRLRK